MLPLSSGLLKGVAICGLRGDIKAYDMHWLALRRSSIEIADSVRVIFVVIQVGDEWTEFHVHEPVSS
jgi:hypothetical protein